MLDATSAELATRDQAVAFRLDRDVVEAVGADATSYLQGQLSQDVAATAVGASRWALLLQPQGKVDTWLRVTRAGDDRWLLDADTGAGPGMLARLERFKLRTDVTFSPLAWSMVAIRGLGAHGIVPPDGVVAADPAWPGIDGIDLLGPRPAVPDGIAEGDPAAYEVLRVRAGVPAMGRELTERTIPAEAGIVERSVSFTKGCYVGQELVARIDSRGSNTPRRLRGLVLQGDVPAPGAPVALDGSVVGEVTSAVRAADSAVVALAYLRRGVEPPARVEVDGRVAEVSALPVA